MPSKQTQPGDDVFKSNVPAHLIVPNVANAASLANDDESVELDTLPDALEVARYLIQLAAAEEEPEHLTHMRLQKLMYYSQGWSLALRDRPLFSGKIEAWAHGPVVRELYKHFADYGDQPIPPSAVQKPQKLTADDREFIASVWSAYRVHSATSLRNMTHLESPWIDARKGVAPIERCNKEITKEAMKQFFDRASKRD